MVVFKEDANTGHQAEGAEEAKPGAEDDEPGFETAFGVGSWWRIGGW